MSVDDQRELPDQILNNAAAELSGAACAAIFQNYGDVSALGRNLADVKDAIVRKAQSLAAPDFFENCPDGENFLWELAARLPDFDERTLLSRRLSPLPIAMAVTLGWLLGGFVSGLLNFFDLGGDILQAASIFCFIWLEEYLSSTPGAREKFLKIFGWISLTGVAARMASGMFSVAGGIRSAIFGSLRPGLFKGAWLLLGALLVFVFFSKKGSFPDRKTFNSELKSQILSRLKLAALVIEKADSLGKLSAGLQKNNAFDIAGNRCPKSFRQLAEGVVSVLNTLEPGPAEFLRDKLSQAGFFLESPADDYFHWQEGEHEKMYEQVGFIENGARCVILKRPLIKDGEILKKGRAQKMAEDMAGA